MSGFKNEEVEKSMSKCKDFEVLEKKMNR